MDAINDGSLAPVAAAPVAARRAKPADHHTIQAVLLPTIFFLGVIGVVGAMILGQSTIAFIIGLVASAIILGTVC
jgi:hypothetical protein